MTSKIKVDNINKVSDDSNIIKKCGTTVTVGAASDGVRTGADNLQAADGGNLISQSGTTITLGASGDTITLASGASQTGFGREGSVDWQTASIKTATFTAASGEGYFCNTAGGTFEVDLPAGSPGAIVAVQDYNNTFDTHGITVDPNGSEKINGGDAGESVSLSTEGLGVTFVYVDSTVGWRSVDSNEFAKIGQVPQYVTATGGTITCSGNFKIHTFTGPGTFCVSNAGNVSGSNTIDYLVIGGGGAGGSAGGHGATVGSGGGAGGYRFSNGTASGCYTAGPSPLGASGLPVPAQGYSIVVGAGGAASFPSGCTSGSISSFTTITSAGGGGGKDTPTPGLPGGSGGGGGSTTGCGGTGGTGNTPPVSPPQGNNGGDGVAPKQGGGGGGASEAGTPGSPSNPVRGKGGDGLTSCVTASPVARGGGGGGANTNSAPNAGAGGGGAGPPSSSGGAGVPGTANTGGGGGGGPHGYPTGANAGTGGSGIVIIRYKFQN